MHGREHQQDRHCTYSLVTMSRMDLSGDGGGGGKKPPEKPEAEKKPVTIPKKQTNAPPSTQKQPSSGSNKQEIKTVLPPTKQTTPSSSNSSGSGQAKAKDATSTSSKAKETASSSSSSKQITPSAGVKRKSSDSDKDSSSSSSNKKQRIDVAGGPKKLRLTDFEEEDTSQKATTEFARKLSAIIYKANERDPGELCLGPYIFRWMLFVALEQMQADKGELWFWIMHWYANDQIAKMLRKQGQGWEEKKFFSAEPREVMLKFAERILRIAKDANPLSTERSTVSSKPMRELALLVYHRVHDIVQVNKDDTLTFKERKQGEKDPYVSLRRKIGSHLHKATFDAIRSAAPPDSNAWFLWYWLDECAIPLPYRDKKKEQPLSPDQELEYRGDAYILSEVLGPCFKHEPESSADDLKKGAKRKNCPMLDSLYVIEHNLHKVENGKLKNRPKGKHHPQLEGLTAAVLMLTLADPANMLVSKNEFVANDVNGELFIKYLDPTNVLGELIKQDPELPQKIQQYISTCRTELKTGRRYKTETFSTPEELKDAPQTKLQLWAMHRPDAKTIVQDIIDSIHDFVVTKLQGGLLTVLDRDRSSEAVANANRSFRLFLQMRIGFNFIRNVLEPEAESKTDSKSKKGTLQLAAERMFRPGFRFNVNRPANANLYEWAEIPAFRTIDTPPSVALMCLGTSWHINSYENDIGSRYINDDDEKISLISSTEESMLSREHVLTAIFSGGHAGRVLTWWSNGSRRICSFVVLKTRKDDDNKSGGSRVTIVVPTDIDLIARLHLLDVLREKMVLKQLTIDNNNEEISQVSLTASQLEKLWNLCFLAKDGHTKKPVDFRLIDAMMKLMTRSQTKWKKDKKLLEQYSQIPTLSFPQMDKSPVNAWRDNELEHVNANEDIREFNNLLVKGLKEVNDNIWANEFYKPDVDLERQFLENKIPEAIRPAYVGMLDLLVAVKCKAYAYEAKEVFERTVKGRRETETAMQFLAKRETKILKSIEDTDLVLKGITAQKRFMEGVKERDLPSFKDRINDFIDMYDERIEEVQERMDELQEEDNAIQDAEEEEDRVNDAAVLLKSRELHINAYLKTHSVLYEVVADLEKLVKTGKPALDLDTVKKTFDAAVKAIEVVSEYLEAPITIKFDLGKQLRAANKETKEKYPEAVHYHNKLREMPKEVTQGKTSEEVSDMVMYLMTADRLRMHLIHIEHIILRKAMMLANPKYVDRDGDGDGDGVDDDDDNDARTRVRVIEDDEDNDAAEFKEGVYLKTERDVVSTFDDTELIVETAYNIRLCGLTMKDFMNAFMNEPLLLQQTTRELLTEEYNSQRQEDQAIDVDVNLLQPLNPMEVDTEAEDQKPRLTEEGERLLRIRRRMLQKTTENDARKIGRKERKGDSASMDTTSDEKKVLLQSDADRRLIKSTLTRLRIVAHILFLQETLNFDLNDIPRLEAGMEQIGKDHRAKVIFLLKEKDETFNKRANDYLKLEFIDKKFKEASERKKAATFVLGMDIETKKLDDLGLDSKSFKRSELNTAKTRQQAMAIIDPERVLMELRYGRRHPNLSLENVMHSVCKILHGNSRPRLWTLMDTAGWILQWAPNEITARWQQQTRDNAVAFKDGAAGSLELYQTINRIMLQQCIPFRVLRLQLILGLVPDITDLQHRGEFLSGGGGGGGDDDDDAKMEDEEEEGSGGGGDDGSSSSSMLSSDSSNAYQHNLILLENDLIARVERTKEIRKADFLARGTADVDGDLLSILTRDYDEKSNSIKEAQQFLTSLCTVMYDEAMADDNKQQLQTLDVNDVNPIDKGYDRKASYEVRAIVQQTFGSEFKHNAIKNEDVEKKVQELKDEQENPEYVNAEMSDKDVKATRERVTRQFKRGAVLKGVLNKAVEWISADEKVQTEHSMLQHLIEVRLRDMFGTYKTQLWDVMLNDMEKQNLSKFVEPEVECLLKVALQNASKEDVLLKPLTKRLDFFINVFEANTKTFMTALREAKVESAEHIRERVFGLNAALQDISIPAEVFLKLQESRHAWYQVAYAGIRYMQLLPYMAQLVKETLPDDVTSKFQWSTHESPSVFVGFAFPDAGRADKPHRKILYREFQEVSEILVNYGVYLPTHLDFQAVIETYHGVDPEKRSDFGNDILAFWTLYPCEPSEAESLQSVRRLLGWQNPRDAIEYYVYKRQLQPDKPIDPAAYRDTLAPVHWELGTISLERQYMPSPSSGESKDKKTTYPYWRSEARALRHAARLARMHLTVLEDEVSKHNKKDPNGYYVRGMKTLAEAARMFKEQKGATTQGILTRLAIPIPLETDAKLISTISMLKGNEMKHLYRGVFPYDNVTQELIRQGTFKPARPGGFTDLGKEIFGKTDDSLKLGLRQEQEKLVPDPGRELAIKQRTEKKKKKKAGEEVDQDWADMKQEAIDNLIDSLTLPVASTRLYFREEKGQGTKLNEDGDFARWATVDAWNRDDDELRKPVMRALGRKVTERKQKKKKKEDDDDEVPALDSPEEARIKKKRKKKIKTAMEVSDEEDDSRPIVTTAAAAETKRTGKGKATAAVSVGSGKETKGEGKDTKQQQSPRSRAASLSLTAASSSSRPKKPTQTVSKSAADDDMDDLDVPETDNMWLTATDIKTLQQIDSTDMKDRPTGAKGKGKGQPQQRVESTDVKDRPTGPKAITEITLYENEDDDLDYQRTLKKSLQDQGGRETLEQQQLRAAMEASIQQQNTSSSSSSSNAQNATRQQQKKSSSNAMDISGRFHATTTTPPPPKMKLGSSFSSVLHPAAIQEEAYYHHHHHRRPVRRLLKFQRPGEALQQISV
jgi:hypothetical protein